MARAAGPDRAVNGNHASERMPQVRGECQSEKRIETAARLEGARFVY